ncbi:MAG: TolB-like 6-bladed beta-propeller domain-containing protein [Tannerella sp.]|jgi:hypothetical protein|nr:TolB-like 6-bladed beta-propeller domain-containing protein [Tannerella sp.]
MNKKISNIVLSIVIISLFVGCKSNKDEEIFNGEIQYFDDSRAIVKKVVAKPVTMANGIPTGMIAAYDSLLICWNPRRDDFFNLINLDTGEEIGSFCKKGQGPQEATSVNCIYQLFKKESDLCTFLWDYNQSRLFLWNISQSVESGKTVYDTIISYDKNRYFFLFYQPENFLFVNRPSDILNREEATTPFYEKRTINTKEIIQNYRIYKNVSLRKNDASELEYSFYTWDVMKPDGSKIAQAMRHLPQINILDTHTGNLVGYRMNNGTDFSFLERDADIKSMTVYYFNIHADNNYIYATYWGKEMWNDRIGDELPHFNMIHVFDWSGKPLYKLITDRSFLRIWLEPVRNRLYTIDPNKDEVYYLDLNELEL